MERQCKDCKRLGITTVRKLSDKNGKAYPGPRCREHHYIEKRRVRQVNHDRRVAKTYGITPKEYQDLYDAQDGRCFICRRATGKTKKLSVDHEHNKPGCEHEPETGCRRCVRCLACATCNRIILGRYDVDALLRAIVVLTDPPARKVLQ